MGALEFMQFLQGGGGLLRDFFNVAQQSENLAYQKDLQKKLFAREDNAVQRRVADLKAAGLNPVLAAGQGALAGPVVPTAPVQAPDPGQRVLNAMQLQQMAETVDNIKMSTNLEYAQARKAWWEQEEVKSRINRNNLMNTIDRYNLDWSAKYGLKTTDNGSEAARVQSMRSAGSTTVLNMLKDAGITEGPLVEAIMAIMGGGDVVLPKYNEQEAEMWENPKQVKGYNLTNPFGR